MGPESPLRFCSEIGREPKFLGSLTVAGVSVNIYGEFDDFLENFKRRTRNYSKDIPGWEFDCIQRESVPSVVLLKSPETSFDYYDAKRVLVVSGRPDDFKDGQALSYIGFWLTEAERQRNSVFTVHAAGVILNEQGVLLLGDSGSGKTSTALTLAKENNAKILANDLSVISKDPHMDSVLLEFGSQYIRLREAAVKKHFPDLEYLFKKGKPFWLSKIVVFPEELGVETATGPVPIMRIFEVHLDATGKEPLSISKLSGIEVKFRLYEDLSRIVRGSAISIFGEQGNILGYLPSLDTADTHRNRVELIDYLVEKLGIWHVTGGSLTDVCQAIVKPTYFGEGASS